MVFCVPMNTLVAQRRLAVARQRDRQARVHRAGAGRQRTTGPVMPTGRSLRLWSLVRRGRRGRRQGRCGAAARFAPQPARRRRRVRCRNTAWCRRSAAASRGWNDGRCAGCPAAPRSARRWIGSRRFWSSWPSSRTALRVSLPGLCHCRYGLHGNECVAQHGWRVLPRRERRAYRLPRPGAWPRPHCANAPPPAPAG